MLKNRFMLSLLVLVMLTVITAGCGGGAFSGSKKEAASSSSESNASPSPSDSAKSNPSQAPASQASDNAQKSGEQIKLKMIGTLPIKSFGTTALNDFKKNVEGASNGSIQVETFPAGQLYNDKDAVNVLPTGAVDIGMCQMDFWTGKVPLIGALYIPMLFDNYDHYYRSRDAISAQLDKSLQEKAHVKLIGWFNYNDQSIISKDPIRNINDFKGKRMRGWGQYSSAFFQYAGSTAVSMGAGDVYDALSKGAIDGAMSTAVSHLSRKFYEVAKNVTDMSLEPVTPYAILVNLDTWNKLSDDQKKILMDAGQKSDAWSRDEAQKETKTAMAQLKEKGVNIITIEGKDYKTIQDSVLPKLKDHFLSQTGDEGKALLQKVEDERIK